LGRQADALPGLSIWQAGKMLPRSVTDSRLIYRKKNENPASRRETG
jgi:hypothetical protein